MSWRRSARLHRLECVLEAMHYALNQLSAADPAWVQQHVPLDWYTRYGLRSDQTRLPKEASKREALARQVGADGYQLLDAVWAADERAVPPRPARLGGAPADLGATILSLYRPGDGRGALAHHGGATAGGRAHHLAL